MPGLRVDVLMCAVPETSLPSRKISPFGAFDAAAGPMLMVLLAALGSVVLAVVLTAEVRAGAPILVTLFQVSLAVAAVAIGIACDAYGERRHFERREPFYRDLIHEHFLISTFDAEGRFQRANENFLKRTGFTAEELVGERLGELRGENLSAEDRAAMWAALRAGKTWSGTFGYRAAATTEDGTETVWVKATVVPRMRACGALASVTVVGTDTTEQRAAELALAGTHARLEAFIKNVPAAVAMVDREMRYVAHTERWLKDYRLAQTSLVGLDHYEVFPEIPEHWRLKHARVLAGATERCDEERWRRLDGTENVLRWEMRPWYDRDDSIGGIIMLTEDISERKRMEAKLWELAKIDGLTGLPNRRLFNETLKSALAHASDTGSSLGVALIDIDHFKEINDTLGHDAGDEMLKIVARRLESALQGRGTIARLGGDEFALVIVDESSGSDVCITEAIKDVEMGLMEPINLAGALRSCSASIGVSLFPQDATEPSDLLKNADLALYEAKNLGRSRSMLFSVDLRASIDRRVALLESAFDAIEGGQFALYFQPIVPSAPSEPLSFEALLRWHHPIHGTMAPGTFEELLDEPRIAAALGERVVDLALTQAAQWQAEDLPFGRIAINVSTADFAFGCFAERLQEKLLRFGVAPQKICIEVTERVFLGAGASHVGQSLYKLDALGVQIALDDFGTGYASLSHIKAYPIGRIKIDRSFVADMQNNRDSLSIVAAIIQLGRSLDVSVTAEGVEDEGQLVLLRSMGCGSVQGYYFAKPLPADEVAPFIRMRLAA